jgi:hypothetical protein
MDTQPQPYFEFKYRGGTYRLNRMNMMSEAKIARRLVPVFGSMKVLSEAWKTATDALIASPGNPEEVRKRMEETFLSRVDIWDDFAAALRELPDDDLTFIINECMATLERQDNDGVRGWSRLWDSVTQRPYFSDIRLPQVLGLVSIVLEHEFRDFFA